MIRKFFSIFLRKFFILIYVGLLYLLTLIPGPFTFGAANTALAAVSRSFCLGEAVFPAHEYLTQFRKNFRRCFLVGFADWIIVAFAFLYTMFVILVAGVAPSGDVSSGVMLFLPYPLLVFYFFARFYLYVMLAALNQDARSAVKNAFRFAILGVKRNIPLFLLKLLAGATLYAGMFAGYFVFGNEYAALLLMPYAHLTFITVYAVYPLIQKYIINPYYEQRGEVNPEITREQTDSIFKDETKAEY
ncbi:hypothetical protein FACS1894133_4980 [Clostridia bacterium]|nr:hypothetical protein FACS1894133_4980 [Clostridia bacterium]